MGVELFLILPGDGVDEAIPIDMSEDVPFLKPCVLSGRIIHDSTQENALAVHLFEDRGTFEGSC